MAKGKGKGRVNMSKAAKAASAKARREQTKNHGRLAGAKLRSTVHGKARLPFTASQGINKVGKKSKNKGKGGKK